ncbi:MAG: DUF5666 domain-containing protein [Acidobacteriota bacterium]
MLSLKKASLIGAGLALALALYTTGPRANTPTDGSDDVVFAGPLTASTSTSLTLQGVTFSITTDTLIKGLDSTGSIVDVDPTTLVAASPVTVYGHDDNGVAVADLVFAGDAFRFSGTVTALQVNASGGSEAVIDGIYTVEVGQTTFVSPGDSVVRRSAGEDQGGGTMQVGSEVVLLGIAQDGVFTAVYGRVESGGGSGSGTEAIENGFILTPSFDASGNLTGFTMSSRGSVATIVLGSSTQISGAGSSSGTAALTAGRHVKVWGTTQTDGSVLASQVILKGGERH